MSLKNKLVSGILKWPCANAERAASTKTSALSMFSTSSSCTVRKSSMSALISLLTLSQCWTLPSKVMRSHSSLCPLIKRSFHHYLRTKFRGAHACQQRKQGRQTRQAEALERLAWICSCLFWSSSCNSFVFFSSSCISLHTDRLSLCYLWNCAAFSSLRVCRSC